MEFQLNPAQAAAVEHEEGSAIIIAGAGTGKTRVITQRVIQLIEKKKCLPENILALTFTEKAAAEMQERIDLAMPLGFGEVKIRTFHAFCKEILAEAGIEMGIDPDFKLMDQVAAWIFLRENLLELKLDYFRPLGNPTKFIANLSSHFSRLKEEDISPEIYLKYARSLSVEKICNELTAEWEQKEAKKKRKSKKEPPIVEFQSQANLIVKKEKELAQAYQIYEDLLLKESKIDFGGLIYLVLDLFRRRPNILAEYQKLYQYIMVDEFQDTNFAQNKLVEMLANEHNNLMVVGDDDQAIYKFRGASLSNILQFEENYPDSKNFVLNENYRSSQNILDLAYASIQNNNPNRLETKLNINKKLSAKGTVENNKIQVWQFQDDLSEADRITEEILSITNDELRMTNHNKKESVIPASSEARKSPESEPQGLGDLGSKKGADSGQARMTTNLTNNHQLPTKNYSDIAILVRNRASADIFLGELDRKGIPYQFIGNRGLFLQPEVKDLISFLTVLANPSDDIDLFALMQSRYFKFAQIDLVTYLQEARKKNLSLFKYLQLLRKEQKGSETLDMFGEQAVNLEPRVARDTVPRSEAKGDVEGGENFESEKLKVESKKESVIPASSAARKSPESEPQGLGSLGNKQSIDSGQARKTSLLLNDFINLLHNYIEKSQTMSVGQLLWDFLKEVNFENHLNQIAQKQGISVCQLFSGNVNEFFQRIATFEKQNEKKTVLPFIDYLKVQIEAGDNPKTAESNDEDAVKIMTIHASKGLEFKTVFVPALVHNKFPSINRREAIVLADELVKEINISEEFHTEEERRLFYVAITRAKENLYLSYSETYNSGTRKWKSSSFLDEIIENPQIEFRKFEQNAAILDDLESKFTVKKSTPSQEKKPENLFNNYLSYTQINTFKRCPKFYHYRYLLRIPSEPGVAANFGSAVHDALKDFYREIKKKKQIPSFEALKLYLKKNWKSSGYRDSSEEQDYYKNAEEILRQFYHSNEKNWIIPEKIEEAFRIKLYNEEGEYVMINGRIDRIDKLPDGTFEVIDYKTGQLSPYVQKGMKKDLQLSLYAIATRDFMKMESTLFSLYFLKDNQKISAERSEKTLNEAKQEIWDVIDKIKAGDFNATPGSMICQFCDYRKICPDSVV